MDQFLLEMFHKAPTKWKNTVYVSTEIDISLAYNKGIKKAFKKPSAFFSSLVLLEMPKKTTHQRKKQICCESLFYDIISSSIFFVKIVVIPLASSILHTI